MAQDSMLQFFGYSQLPPEKQKNSKPFGELAEWIVANLPDNEQRHDALKLLLQAKDCAVRAGFFKTPETDHPAAAPT